MNERSGNRDCEAAIVNFRSAGLDVIGRDRKRRQEGAVAGSGFKDSAIKVDDVGLTGLRFAEAANHERATVKPQGGYGRDAIYVLQIQIIRPAGKQGIV